MWEKKIGFGWTDAGAAQRARIPLRRITDPREWAEYWKKRLRLDGRVRILFRRVQTVQPQPPNSGTFPRFHGAARESPFGSAGSFKNAPNTLHRLMTSVAALIGPSMISHGPRLGESSGLHLPRWRSRSLDFAGTPMRSVAAAFPSGFAMST